MSDENKKSFIDYTSRDFDSIREDLIEYIKRYYPDTYRDFNTAGFGSTMIDSVSYIGDILSFYLDYNINETFLDTATEFENVLELAKQNGYKYDPSPSSQGEVSFYILVPASTTGNGPNEDYLPILRRGTEVSTQGGNKFILSEDIDFSVDSEKTAGRVNEGTGRVTQYIVRKKGKVVSGELNEEIIDIGAFQRYRRVELSSENVSEILFVKDTDGHRYYEVPNLSQNFIFKSALKDGSNGSQVNNVLKKFVVPRRFVVVRERGSVYLQFGHGSEGAEGVVEPDKVAVDTVGREFVSDASFDPTRALSGDSLGISPSNTQLLVRYRKNTTDNVNAAATTVTNVNNPLFKFKNPAGLNDSDRRLVIDSIEVENDEPITGDVSSPSVDEIKIRAMNSFSTQDRAITSNDYETLIYSMPSSFGTVKRVKAYPDNDSLKRNINIYVISEDSVGSLVQANGDLKNNIKTWISSKKPINDTIDIHDAFIVNFGIEYIIVAEEDYDKFEVLTRANNLLRGTFNQHLDIGEPISITDIYNVLNEVDGVADTVDVEIVKKSGPGYSNVSYDVASNKTPDGRYIHAPKNLIFEVKNPVEDIEGKIR